MGVRGAVAAFCLAWTVVSATPVEGRGPAGQGGSISLGGSFRTVAALLDNYDEPALFGEDNEYDGLSASILRLTAEGSAANRISWEAHLVQDLVMGSRRSAAAGFAFAGAGGARYRALDMTRTLIDDGDVEATLTVDRLNARWRLGVTDLTLGRQAINFSQAYFWNPLDVFLPFDPESFDRSYKPGVDAMRWDVAVGPFSALTVVAAAGRTFRIVPAGDETRVDAVDYTDEPWEGSALLVRGRSTLAHMDATLQAGRVSGGWQVGGGFSGEAGPLGIRGEATWFISDGGDVIVRPAPSGEEQDTVSVTEDYGRVVIGADHLFENSLYVNAEYFFNGAGESEDYAAALARVAVGESTNLGRRYLGLQSSYEIHPLLTGQVAWIHSFTDGSDQVTPTARWSVGDEAECVFGAILGFGDRPSLDGGTGEQEPGSEFGSVPHFYFTELIFYF